MNKTLAIGSLIKTLKGELDLDEDGLERKTAPGEIGRVQEVRYSPDAPVGQRHCHDVIFLNGAWVILWEEEIGDPEQYEVVYEALVMGDDEGKKRMAEMLRKGGKI